MKASEKAFASSLPPCENCRVVPPCTVPSTTTRPVWLTANVPPLLMRSPATRRVLLLLTATVPL